MAAITEIKCDICNKVLEQNEVMMKGGTLGFGGVKPQAKNKIAFLFEGQQRNGDLCFNHARMLRNFIEDLKAGKIKK